MGNAAAKFSVNDNSAAAGGKVMADAGTRIAAAILWFQFVASQVLMLVSMSTAVTGEHPRGRLRSCWPRRWIVSRSSLGKLLAGLLRVGTLLLCSLPLLMLVRVLGGVPADTLIACLVTTCWRRRLGRSHALLVRSISRVGQRSAGSGLAGPVPCAASGHLDGSGRQRPPGLWLASPWAAFAFAADYMQSPAHNLLQFHSVAFAYFAVLHVGIVLGLAMLLLRRAAASLSAGWFLRPQKDEGLPDYSVVLPGEALKDLSSEHRASAITSPAAGPGPPASERRGPAHPLAGHPAAALPASGRGPLGPGDRFPVLRLRRFERIQQRHGPRVHPHGALVHPGGDAFGAVGGRGVLRAAAPHWGSSSAHQSARCNRSRETPGRVLAAAVALRDHPGGTRWYPRWALPLAGAFQLGTAAGLDQRVCRRQRRVPFGVLQDDAHGGDGLAGPACLLLGILPFLLPPVAELAPSNPRQFCEQPPDISTPARCISCFDTVEDSGGHESRQIKSQIGRGAEDSIPQANFAEPPSDEDLRELRDPADGLRRRDNDYRRYWPQPTLRQSSARHPWASRSARPWRRRPRWDCGGGPLRETSTANRRTVARPSVRTD